MICAWRLSIVIAAPVLKKHGIKFFKHNVSLTILTTVHPRAAAAALSPSRGRKGLVPHSTIPPQRGARVSTGNPRFPLRGSAAVAAKGCTGWSVAMTLYRHPDRQTAACLPMQALTILTVEHPCATAWPSLHRKASHEIFSRLWLLTNFVRLPPLKGAQDISAAFYFCHPSRGARVSDEKTRFPLRVAKELDS